MSRHQRPWKFQVREIKDILGHWYKKLKGIIAQVAKYWHLWIWGMTPPYLDLKHEWMMLDLHVHIPSNCKAMANFIENRKFSMNNIFSPFWKPLAYVCLIGLHNFLQSKAVTSLRESNRGNETSPVDRSFSQLHNSTPPWTFTHTLYHAFWPQITSTIH